MRNRFSGSMIVGGRVVGGGRGAVVSLSMTPRPPARRRGRRASADGKPNFSGIWQANNEAHWDLQAHEARAGASCSRASIPTNTRRCRRRRRWRSARPAACPDRSASSQGDGQIPYKPEALAARRRTRDNWIDRDPELKC